MEIFREIPIGGMSKEQLIQRLADAGIRLNAYAKQLFEHPAFCPDAQVENFKLVKIKPADLGLKNPYSLERAIRQATSLGLRPCPLHLAAFLRLEYLDQPEGPYLTVASVRPEKDESHPAGFYIRNFEKSLWLRGYRALGECDHPADNEFIFVA